MPALQAGIFYVESRGKTGGRTTMVNRFLDHLEEWLITFLIAAATLIIFAAVMHRYASGLPIPLLQDWLLGLHMGWVCVIKATLAVGTEVEPSPLPHLVSRFDGYTGWMVAAWAAILIAVAYRSGWLRVGAGPQR